MKDKKVYLGDGVYIEDDGHQLKLSTENGVSTTNVIYMNDTVLEAFEQYLAIQVLKL